MEKRVHRFRNKTLPEKTKFDQKRVADLGLLDEHACVAGEGTSKRERWLKLEFHLLLGFFVNFPHSEARYFGG